MSTEKRKLNELVEFQKESIVSKHLIKKEKGNITLFAMSKKEKISEHTTPFKAFVYVINGNMNIRIGKEIFNLKTGETIIMPEDIPHELIAEEDTKFMLVMIKQ